MKRKAQKYYPDELVYLRKHFYEVKKDDLLDHLNKYRSPNNQVTLSQLRHQLRRMGLQRMKQIRWNKTQIKFLKQNYKTKGDVEIARLLNEKKSRSKKVFTRKNVGRKRRLLGWNRTEEQIKQIVKRNNNPGRFKKGYASPRKEEEGARTIVKCTDGTKREMIKVNGEFILYPRYLYQSVHGEIERSMYVFHKDLDPLNNDIDNLYLSKPGLLPISSYRTAKRLLTKRMESVSRNMMNTKPSQRKELGWEMSRLSELLNKIEKKIKRYDKRVRKNKQ